MTPDLATGRRFLAAQGAAGALLVGVTGAHYYGFPSPDSDLDLKGIHVTPTEEVVSLHPPPTSVDLLGVFEGLEIDYTSHELAFALRLLLKGNGNILERIVSPFQLLDTPDVAELQGLARGAVSKRFFHHYRGYFGRMCRDWAGATPRTVKGLLYAYRSALTGIHLLRTGCCIGDVTRLAPLYGFPEASALVDVKRNGKEHGEMAAADRYGADLERLESALAVAANESPLPSEAANVDALDRFLVRMRLRHFGPQTMRDWGLA